MDKLVAIRIKHNDGTYSNEIPLSVLAINIDWDGTHSLVDVLGNVDLNKGSIQEQINALITTITPDNVQYDLTHTLSDVLGDVDLDKGDLQTQIDNISDGEIQVDSTLTAAGKAADAKAVGDNLKNVVRVGNSNVTNFTSIILGDTAEQVNLLDQSDLIDINARLSALENGGIQVDQTLSVQGMAADAKATGDAIHNLQGLVGTPLVAATAASMTNTDKIYVYTGSETGYTNGNWYYYDGTAWTSGGVYNSIAMNMDTVPTSGSSNPVTSGGIKAALDLMDDDISSLNEDLNELDRMINGVPVLTPFPKSAQDFDDLNFYITPSSGKWSAGNKRGYVIALTDEIKIVLTANSGYAAQVAFLGNISCVAGEQAPVVGDTTCTTVSAGITVELSVPDGSNYFYMRRIDNDGYSLVPSSITFYSYRPPEESIASLVQQNSDAVRRMRTSKIAHLSFDDVHFCMEDLTTNAGTYESIFDNPFFAMLKNLHDTYNAVISLYLFISNISNYTTAFSNEFTENADWLKFGIHQGATDYSQTTATTATSDYNAFTSNIVAICGTVDAIDRCPRLGGFDGNLESVLAMRDADAGIVGLLTTYASGNTSYYLDSDQSAYVYEHGAMHDPAYGLSFFRTLRTLENVDPTSSVFPDLLTVGGVNGSDYCIMMMHEYEVYNSSYAIVSTMENRLRYVCNWVSEHGYRWIYPMYVTLKSPCSIGEGGGVSDYSDLSNKPQINSVALVGNKTLSDLGIASASELDALDAQINGSGGGSSTEDITSSVQWTSGGSVFYNSGAIDTSATNYSHADISMTGISHVSGYIRAGQESNKGVAFLDSNGRWISGDYHAGASSYDWNYDLNVPSNAAIFRICCATSRLSQFTCTVTRSSSGGDGIASDVNALKAKINSLTLNDDTDVNISSPSGGQALVYNAVSGKWVNGQVSSGSDVVGTTPEYYWIDGYYVSKYYLSSRVGEGTYVANANRSLAIVDIHAFAGGRITGHTRLADDSLIAFYDHNDIYISSIALPSGSSNDFDYDINVPVNAKTVKVSCGTSYKNAFTIKGYNLINGINNSTHDGALEYEPPAFVFGLDSDKSDFHYGSQTRLADMYKWFDILASTFPRNITKVEIGESTTPEGSYATIDSSVYKIYGYIIQGDNYISGNDFIIASGMHGDEQSGDGIQSVVSVAYFIRDMLFNPGKNKYLAFMKWNCKILVIPVMNPWGYQNGKRCNGRGVDCNRNFDLNWTDTTSYGYSSGTAAFSENESRLVANYISTNFSTAKYCTELHTRGGNTLPQDDRWWTKVTVTNTVMQAALTDVGYYLRRIYGGTLANGTSDGNEPTFRAYVDVVIGIPTNLTEFAKSVNSDITTFNSDSVQIQYVQYLGAMTQKLVETFVM